MAGDLNVFDPSDMGWFGARQGAVGSLTGMAPLSALAGAGIGALLSPKKRLRGALIGAGVGGLAGMGGSAAFHGYDAYNNTDHVLGTASQNLQSQIGEREAGDGMTLRTRWDTAKYLRDLMGTKAPASPTGQLLAPQQQLKLQQDTPTIPWYNPWGENVPPMAHQMGNTARDQLVRDELKRHASFPISDLMRAGPDALERAREWAGEQAGTAAYGTLRKEWPDQRLGEYVARQYRGQ